MINEDKLSTFDNMTTVLEEDRQTFSAFSSNNQLLKQKLVLISNQLASLQQTRSKQSTTMSPSSLPRTTRRFKNTHYC